jgi:hypothetical protein
LRTTPPASAPRGRALFAASWLTWRLRLLLGCFPLLFHAGLFFFVGLFVFWLFHAELTR